MAVHRESSCMSALDILMLEDDPLDAEILQRELSRSGLSFTTRTVDGEAAYRAALEHPPDVILADFALGGFDGLSALSIAREVVPDTPFIFVTGSLGDENVVVEALRSGATDYILKDRLSRLATAVQRAIVERESARKRRAAEEALRASERRFEVAVRATRDVIWEYDIAADTIWVNEAMESVWGHAVENEHVTPEWWRQQIHPEDAARVIGYVEESLAGSAERLNMRFRFRHARGHYGHVHQRGIILREGGRAVRVVGAMQNMTALVERERELRELDERYELILSNAAIGILEVTRSGKTVFLNRTAQKLLGRNLDEMISSVSVHDALHGDSEHPPEACPLLAPLRDGVPRYVQSTFVTASGASLQVACTSSVIRGSAGTPRGAVITFKDETHEWRLKSQLDQERRISALGRITAVIGHEVNNVLMAIQPMAELLVKISQDPKAERAATQIIAAVRRGRNITQDILRATNPGEPNAESFDLRDWLEEATQGLTGIVPRTIELQIDIPEEPLPVRCDPNHLLQIVTNLVTNARDAMPAGGVVRVSLSSVPGAGDDADLAQVAVADSGGGIAPEVLPQIFEPLFTTKRSGTGLGLAVVAQLVARNGGTISVDSSSAGTTFTIRLALDTRALEDGAIDQMGA